MKYEYYPKRRTEQERRELNEQILRLLQSEACEQAGVTDEDIFNRYTGDGGLHGLRRSDYENYNAFSAAKKELENGQFFTPPPLCEMIVSALRLTDTDLVADLTCGMGNFFNFLPNENTAYGCEVDPNACAVARKLYPQAHIVQGDIRDYEPQTHFDFVLGNPPFHLRWVMPDATVMVSHQYYCLKAAKLLKPLGILAVIVPASFLADSFSDKGAIRMMESHFSFLGQVMLPEHAFSDSGVDGFPTKLQFWQKKSTAADWTPKRYSTDCADIYIPSGHPVMAATALYEKFVMVAKADLAGNRNKVLLELAQLKTTKSTFLYQVKKYLYQIRSHPATREKYDACFSYVHRFYTQRQPGDMPYEEWQRVQLTEAKVLAYLKQALCRQNAKPERDEIRLVKQKYSFVYKAYSRKMAKLLTDEMRAPVPIYQAVLNDEPERFPGYERLLRRKRREYDNQEQPFSEMAENAQHADWIGRFQYWDAQNHAYIHLNPLQSHDVNLTLQKRYAFLQWEQGSGKTPAAIFTGKHRVEMGAVHSIWVISSAISIRNNWDVILKGAGFSYVFVERLSDLQRIRPGDFVILTLNKVSQYKKQIGRYIKQLGYKIQFIFDESDNISNPSSKQTLSVVLRPLIAEIIGNIAAVCLLTGSRLNAVCFQLVLHIIPCLPADILETVDHAFARVHGEPSKAEVINTLGLDKLGNALFHVAPRQLLRICGHTLCGSLEQLCRAHGIQPFQRGLFRPPLFRLLGVPLCFALGFRRFVRTAGLILTLGVVGGCRFAGRRCRSRSCSRRTCCHRFHRSRLRHIHSIIFRKGVGNGSLAVLKLIIHI